MRLARSRRKLSYTPKATKETERRVPIIVPFVLLN
jgi:hypothetical protein